MLSKAQIKLIQSLKDKKHRQEHRLFIAEGTKIVSEVLASKIQVKSLFATAQWLDNNHSFVNKNTRVETVSENELKKISQLQTPQQVLAVCQIPDAEKNFIPQGLSLVLDTIQDPGNMGTIIRVADWYGIKQIVLSSGCADVYSSKVIQASMGSFLRVAIIETELSSFIKAQPLPVYGALMKGESLYNVSLPPDCLLVIGNEGAGISSPVRSLIDKPITIPRRGEAESLNAGIAAAIICDAWARIR